MIYMYNLCKNASLFVGQLEWVDKLSWGNEQIYKNATRKTMWVDKIMEGYYKTGGGLSFYWVNVAGQNVSFSTHFRFK